MSCPQPPVTLDKRVRPRTSLTGPDDRYCEHCGEVALVFDPAADGPRCRNCGELA